MLKQKLIAETLQKKTCYKCGASLEEAQLVSVSEAPTLLVAHTVCPSCSAESMLTITPNGSGLIPVQSDLTGNEFKKFIGQKAISYEELFDLHKALKKESIWKLLQKKEQNSENQARA